MKTYLLPIKRCHKKVFVLAAICGFMILLSCSQKPSSENTAAQNTAVSPAKKPAWIKGPVVMTGSNQEPLIFLVRRGGKSLKVKENYLRSHTAEYVKEMKDFGGTFFMSHVFKGFGIEAEREDIELAKKLSPILHENGFKMGTYIGSSIGYETFLLEKPEAEEWLVPEYLGQAVTYGDQYYRRRPYIGHPGYRSYIKQVVDIAINEIGSDLIHFDNPANQAVPAVFHHPMAIQDFREFLKKKYTPEKLIERIGFSDVSRILPPAYPKAESFQSFNDPITQEWIDFRCQMLADYYKEMESHIRRLNPEVAVEINPHGITGGNRAWESSVDFQRLLPHVDFFWCEDGNPASVNQEGILVSNIRSYKIGRTFNNKVFNVIGNSPVRAAELLAYNPSLTFPGESVKNFVAFYHKNFAHYANTKDIADVAILRSFPSMAYNNYSTHQSTILFEQVLIQCKIPFDIIYDDHLKDLSKYSVLILANQESLRDDHLELIREFVGQGGGLVATENSSLYDDWRRERENFGLNDLFGIDRPSSIKSVRIQDGGAMESIEEYELRQAGKTIKNQFGKGKVAYIPLIEPSKERPSNAPMMNSYWKLPLNYSEMVDAIKWATGKDLSINVSAPLTVTMQLTEKEGKMMVHLINYNVEKEKSVKNISVSLKIPAGKQVKELLLLSPDRDGYESLNYSVKDGRAVFTVPNLEVYDLVVVNLI
jgi:Beta-galactosidase